MLTFQRIDFHRFIEKITQRRRRKVLMFENFYFLDVIKLALKHRESKQ